MRPDGWLASLQGGLTHGREPRRSQCLAPVAAGQAPRRAGPWPSMLQVLNAAVRQPSHPTRIGRLNSIHEECAQAADCSSGSDGNRGLQPSAAMVTCGGPSRPALDRPRRWALAEGTRAGIPPARARQVRRPADPATGSVLSLPLRRLRERKRACGAFISSAQALARLYYQGHAITYQPFRTTAATSTQQDCQRGGRRDEWE